MNIAPVSFGSTPTEFSEKIKAPQRYVQKETPAAATSLSKLNKKKGSFGKTVLKLALAAAAVAAALALGAKKEVFKSDKIKNETLKNVCGHLQTAGERIGEKATHYYGLAKEKLSALTKKAAEKAPEVASETPAV